MDILKVMGHNLEKPSHLLLISQWSPNSVPWFWFSLPGNQGLCCLLVILGRRATWSFYFVSTYNSWTISYAKKVNSGIWRAPITKERAKVFSRTDWDSNIEKQHAQFNFKLTREYGLTTFLPIAFLPVWWLWLVNECILLSVL